MRRRFVSAEELAYYRAHFLEALREDGVVCLECGILYRFLGRHVRQHGLTLDEYREEWGYNRSTALITPALHEAQRQRALARDLGALGAPNLRRNAPERRQRLNPAPRREALLHLSVAVKARYAAGARPPSLKVEDETLRALVAAGLTSREIAARTGLHRNWLGRRLQSASGPPFPLAWRRMPRFWLSAARVCRPGKSPPAPG